MGSQNDIFGFEAYVEIDDETAYAISSQYNAFFKINRKTRECSYISSVPGEVIEESRLYVKGFLCNNKIYFLPLVAKEIAVYDLQSTSFKKIALKPVSEEENEKYKPKIKFMNGIIYGDKVIAIGGSYPAILIIDGNTDTVEYITDGIVGESVLFGKNVWMEGDCICLINVYDNRIFKYDLIKGQGKMLGFQEVDLSKTNNYLYYNGDAKAKVLKWDYTQKKQISYEADATVRRAPEGQITLVYQNKYTNYIPCDKDAEMIKNIFVSGIVKGIYILYEGEQYYCFEVSCIDSKYYLQMNKESRTCELVDYSFVDGKKLYFESLLQRGVNMKESRDISLDDYMNYLIGE